MPNRSSKIITTFNIIATLIGAISAIVVAYYTAAGVAIKKTQEEFDNQLMLQAERIEKNQQNFEYLTKELKKARALDRRVVETYYRWNRPDDYNRHNVKGIDRTGEGVYIIHFLEPFENNLYISVANNTAGFVHITENKSGSVKLKSFDHKGNLVDAEVFFLAYGK